jgi:hypothetical protein
MSTLTITLYILVFGLWVYLVWQEGGIGIGFRFLYALNVILFFLLGPMLEELFGAREPPFLLSRLEPAVVLSLHAFLAYVLGSYVVYPLLINRSRLMPVGFMDKLAEPGRLQAQRKVAWILIGIGFASLPAYGTMLGIPTVRSLWSQLPTFIDTGLVMLCLNAVLARRYLALALVALVLLGKGLVFSAMTGFAGSLFINGMYMACLTVLSAKLRLTHVAGLILIGVLALIPAKMWMSGRDQLRAAIRQETTLEERVGITINIFFHADALADPQDFVSTYRRRGDYSDLLAAALTHTPAMQPYAMGESYLNILVAIVPRILWPDKPFQAGGNEFVSRYTGIWFDQSTSVGTNYLFELYVNFGTPGVLIGMFLLGLWPGWNHSITAKRP